MIVIMLVIDIAIHHCDEKYTKEWKLTTQSDENKLMWWKFINVMKINQTHWKLIRVLNIRVGLIPLTFSIPPWLLFWSALWPTEWTQKFSERLIIIWRWLPALLKYKGICPKIQRKFCCFSFWQFLKKIVLVKNFWNP